MLVAVAAAAAVHQLVGERGGAEVGDGDAQQRVEVFERDGPVVRGHERMHRLDRRFRWAPVADPVEVCGHVHGVGDFRCHDVILRPQYGLRSTRWWNTEEVAAHLTEELREDLLARWSETHRKHHTVAHLHEMLDAIGLLAEAGIEFDREAVELAAWFHDAIYEIGRDDNEDRSAELARELLASSPIRDEVARLVMVTKTHNVDDDDVNGAVLSDADLSVLGSERSGTGPMRRRSGKSTPTCQTRCSNRFVRRCFRRCSTVGCSTRRRDVSGGKNAPDATSLRRFAP